MLASLYLNLELQNNWSCKYDNIIKPPKTTQFRHKSQKEYTYTYTTITLMMHYTPVHTKALKAFPTIYAMAFIFVALRDQGNITTAKYPFVYCTPCTWSYNLFISFSSSIHYT